MKRIFSIGFLLVFLFNIAGYYPLFLIKQQRLRKEIKNTIKLLLPEEKLSYFNIGTDEAGDLRWLKDDEFYYKGNMYDVVRQKHDENGSIHYWCVCDTKEMELLTHFEKEVNKNGKTNAPDQKSENYLIKSMLKDYFPSGKLISNHIIETDVNYYDGNSSIITLMYDVITPPPKST